MKTQDIYIKPYNSKYFPFAAHWYSESGFHYFDVYETKIELIYAMVCRFGKCKFYDWSDSK